jgi:hypothetical protein
MFHHSGSHGHFIFSVPAYKELPTLGMCFYFILYSTQMHLCHISHDIAPYFNSYRGSHVSLWLDFRQLLLRGLVGM